MILGNVIKRKAKRAMSNANKCDTVGAYIEFYAYVNIDFRKYRTLD